MVDIYYLLLIKHSCFETFNCRMYMNILLIADPLLLLIYGYSQLRETSSGVHKAWGNALKVILVE